jgi:hypothetical protein
MLDAQVWKPCNICKTPIAYRQKYYLCSVSTCQRKRTGLVFCSVACFDAHLPMMRHRDAWAEPNDAPSREQAERDEAEAQAEKAAEKTAEKAASQQKSGQPQRPGAVPSVMSSDERRRVATLGGEPVADEEDDVLVVISKLKKFIRTRSGMNTSDGVTAVLSDHLRELSVRALRHAAGDGRKTVLERDFSAVLRGEKS